VAGNRDAFAQIVGRYQSLICSLAYSATGSLSQSEDLAQETFVIAWREMAGLREPQKLKSWLCGIVRRRIGKALRRAGREPAQSAQSLDTLQNAPYAEPLPPDHVINREEEALLWRSLERIPETYREPLVLFYREHQSVETVAAALDLSEDAVKQRLSRGRKLLHQQVLAFVEGTLERTNPGKAFTLGVLAALPVFATTASAATVAGAAAKGSVTAVTSTYVAAFGSLVGPVIGVLGAWFGVRASLDATRTPRERQFVVRQTKTMIVAAVLFNLVIAVYVLAAVKFWPVHPVTFAVIGVSVPLVFAGFILVRAARFNRQFREIRAEERDRHPEAYQADGTATLSEFREYRSSWTFLGLPLVHVRTGNREGEPPRPATGWIALGDRAYGILFAAGGVAVGGISMGGAAVGVVAMGGVAAGVLAIGGIALGGLALGGGAVGLVAAGGAATAWLGAEGGLAIAREFALGGAALARHANDSEARAFFADYPWMDLTRAGNRNWFFTLCWLPLLLGVWQSWRHLKRRRQRRFRCADGR